MIRHAPIHSRRPSGQGASAFTLIELVLVMTILLVVMGVAAPSLGQFFRGRTVDSEARRLLSLTRYAQSRSVSESVPMLLWIDPDRSQYGLEAEYSYTTEDEKSVRYDLNSDVEMEIGRESNLALRTVTAGSSSSTASSLAAAAAATKRFGPKTAVLRFQPDGFISEISPREFWLRQKPRDGVRSNRRSDDQIGFKLSQNGLHYEIQSPQAPATLR